MNFLSLFVLIPLLMLLGLWLSRNISQIRTVMVTGASALLALSIALTVMYLQARQGGATDEMLFCADVAWYPALNIHYSVGVDGISVVMLLLSSAAAFGHHRIHGYFRFLASATAYERIFPLVHVPVSGCVRLLHLDRPVHDVHVL